MKISVLFQVCQKCICVLQHIIVNCSTASSPKHSSSNSNITAPGAATLVTIGALPKFIYSLMDVMMGAPRDMFWFPAILHTAEIVQVGIFTIVFVLCMLYSQ